MPAKGWWDGDNHFHMNYSGVYFNTPKRLMEQGEAEDIHVLNNLICNKEQRIPDVDALHREARIRFRRRSGSCFTRRNIIRRSGATRRF